MRTFRRPGLRSSTVDVAGGADPPAADVPAPLTGRGKLIEEAPNTNIAEGDALDDSNGAPSASSSDALVVPLTDLTKPEENR